MNGPREIRLFRSAVWSLVKLMSQEAVDLGELAECGIYSPKYLDTRRWYLRKIRAARALAIRRWQEALKAGYQVRTPIHLPLHEALVRGHADIMEGEIDLTIYWKDRSREWCILPDGRVYEALAESDGNKEEN